MQYKSVPQCMNGFYMHFKYRDDSDGVNGCYEVVGLSEDTEAGLVRVIYRPLYKLPDLRETSSLNRTLGNFTSMVGEVPRFRKITDGEKIKRCKEAAKKLYGSN